MFNGIAMVLSMFMHFHPRYDRIVTIKIAFPMLLIMICSDNTFYFPSPPFSSPLEG